MTASSAIDTLVLTGLVPAITVVAGALAFASYYRKPVRDYLRETEASFHSYARSADTEDRKPRALRKWSEQMYKAHTYRNAHGRTVKVSAAGALGWVLSYSTESLGVSGGVFTSPFGVPAPLGIKIMAVLAWTAAVYYSILIINKFGVRPEEVVAEEVGESPQTD